METVPEVYPSAEFTSVDADYSTSYPLIDISKNGFDSKPEDLAETNGDLSWGSK